MEKHKRRPQVCASSRRAGAPPVPPTCPSKKRKRPKKRARRKKCRYCGRGFMPDRRVGKRQKRCFEEKCRRKEGRRRVRKWVRGHPKEKAERRVKARAWSYAYPHYWRQYRKTHQEYMLRDNERRTIALRKIRCSAKITQMRTVAVEKLRLIQRAVPENCSAKLTQRDRRVEGIMNYLLWTVGEKCPQSITHMDFDRPGA